MRTTSFRYRNLPALMVIAVICAIFATLAVWSYAQHRRLMGESDKFQLIVQREIPDGSTPREIVNVLREHDISTDAPPIQNMTHVPGTREMVWHVVVSDSYIDIARSCSVVISFYFADNGTLSHSLVHTECQGM